MKEILPEDEQKIIDFYCMPNSLREAHAVFNLPIRQINAILNKHKIKRYDSKTLTELTLRKRKQTNLKKYGVEWTSQVSQFIEKSKTTWNQKSEKELAEIRQKIENTCLEKYGTKTVFEAAEVKKKITGTMQQKYNVDNYTKTTEYIKKTTTKNKEKYGKEWFTQTREYHLKAKKLFKVNNNYFDSFPELCFYLYHIEKSIIIERCPESLFYTFNDISHEYIPDFKCNNELIELKGPQFTKNGKWINPYDRTQDELYEAKHQCALENNVKILYEAGYQKYVDWFFEHGYKKEDFITGQ